MSGDLMEIVVGVVGFIAAMLLLLKSGKGG